MIPLTLLFNRYTAGAALAVALAAGGYAYRGHLIGLGYSRAETEFQAQQTDRLREQSRETSRLQGVVNEAERRAAERSQTAQRAAAGARSELDRLRNAQRAAATAATTCPAISQRADALDTVFGSCTAALVELGRAADAHAADAARLSEAWPVSLD